MGEAAVGDRGGWRGELDELRAALEHRVRERPISTLALAAAAGYVAGGGLSSPLTRPLARAALGAFGFPALRDWLTERGHGASGAAAP